MKYTWILFFTNSEQGYKIMQNINRCMFFCKMNYLRRIVFKNFNCQIHIVYWYICTLNLGNLLFCNK